MLTALTEPRKARTLLQLYFTWYFDRGQVSLGP